MKLAATFLLFCNALNKSVLAYLKLSCVCVCWGYIIVWAYEHELAGVCSHVHPLTESTQRPMLAVFLDYSLLCLFTQCLKGSVLEFHISFLFPSTRATNVYCYLWLFTSVLGIQPWVLMLVLYWLSHLLTSQGHSLLPWNKTLCSCYHC